MRFLIIDHAGRIHAVSATSLNHLPPNVTRLAISVIDLTGEPALIKSRYQERGPLEFTSDHEAVLAAMEQP